MNSNLQYLVLVGVVIHLIGVFSYIRETIAGRTKPNRVSWLLWAVAPLIAVFASFSTGVRWAVIPVFSAALGPILIFIASFFNKKSYWKLGLFDYLCGLFSVLALVLWGITKNPNLAILFAIISDIFAAIPTLIKSWKYPETESVSAYATDLFSNFTIFAVVKNWNFSELAFPIYLILINSSLVLLIIRKKPD